MKKFVCGLLVGVLGTGIISVGAAGIWDNISVLRNDISVIVNGENITADNFVYNDTTYLPLRAVSEALNQPVNYDETTNTAYIGERNDNTVKSKYIPPQELMNRGILLIDGIYYIMGNTVFDIAYKDRKYSCRLDNLTNELILYNGALRGDDGEEIGRWATMEIDGWYYIPYDTYVDEIEPLLK